MKYLGAITSDYDIVNKKYVDDSIVDEKVKLTSTTTTGSYPIVFGPTSISSGTAYNCNYTTSLYVNPNTNALYVSSGTTNGDIYMGLSTTDALYTAINSLGWTSSVIV